MKVTFPKEPDFFYKDVCIEVRSYFKKNNINRYGNDSLLIKYLVIKTVLMICYTLVFWIESLYGIFLLFTILGPLSIILAINISHDAVHGVAHSNKFINWYFRIQMDLIGANSYVWKKRHQFGHHTFPNTLGKDPDVTQSNIVKIIPKVRHKSYHRFQHLYVPFLYCLYSINWIFVRDFKDFFAKNSLIKDIPVKEYIKLLLFKLLYISVFVVMPYYFTFLSIGQILFCNLLLHFSASYFLTLALVPSHVSENSVFVEPDANGRMPYSWAHHQVKTTTDFATSNSFITWVLGGFNHHIAHHLFPNISHVHYSKMTPIIKQNIKRYGLKYNHESSVLRAYLSHYDLLKNNGKQ